MVDYPTDSRENLIKAIASKIEHASMPISSMIDQLVLDITGHKPSSEAAGVFTRRTTVGILESRSRFLRIVRKLEELTKQKAVYTEHNPGYASYDEAVFSTQLRLIRSKGAPYRGEAYDRLYMSAPLLSLEYMLESVIPHIEVGRPAILINNG